jgi:hypothetical protein
MGIPEGVDILAWGMKKIAVLLKGMVIKIGMDATYMCFSHWFRSMLIEA